MKIKNNRKYFVFLLIIGISIGFAALATSLSIIGRTLITKQSWDVHWENVVVLEGETLGEEPDINGDRDVVTYTVNLVKPGDTFSFTVDAKNDGTIDAMITNLKNLVYNATDEDTPIDVSSYIDYSITYFDGSSILDNQLLKAHRSETYLVTVKYKDTALAPEDISLKFKLTFDYEMNDGTGVNIRTDSFCPDNYTEQTSAGTVCKRAENLHQDRCDGGFCLEAGYDEGDEVFFGSCGIKGQSPKAGDAFDCDVNNDGVFDEYSERFYYISDSGSNDGYASLIYFDNVANDEEYNFSGINYEGPVSLLDSLPSKDEWSNPGLNTNMTRQILDDKGNDFIVSDSTHALSEFTYTNRAARLLTLPEAYNACRITENYAGEEGILDRCQYLLENAGFTIEGLPFWWLETVDSTWHNLAWFVNGDGRSISTSYSGSSHCVRPVIEVDKTKIAY